jgi:hypothetical protein
VPTKFERRTLLLVLMAACSGEPRRTDSAHRSIGETLGGRIADRPQHRVLVERDGTALAAFGGSRAKAVLDGTHLSIELASEDGAHRLAIEIDGRSPGVYQLAPTFETAKAVILLVSHGLRIPLRVRGLVLDRPGGAALMYPRPSRPTPTSNRVELYRTDQRR